MGRQKPSTPGYLTISRLQTELKKRNIRFPAWGKRKTLLDLYNKSISHTAGSRRTTLINRRSCHARQNTRPARYTVDPRQSQAEDSDDEETAGFNMADTYDEHTPGSPANVSALRSTLAPNSWDTLPGGGDRLVEQPSTEVVVLRSEISTLKHTVAELQKQVTLTHAQSQQEVQLSDGQPGASGGFTLQSIMGNAVLPPFSGVLNYPESKA